VQANIVDHPVLTQYDGHWGNWFYNSSNNSAYFVRSSFSFDLLNNDMYRPDFGAAANSSMNQFGTGRFYWSQGRRRPSYCDSTGYRVGDFIDSKVGGTIKTGGVIVVVGGGAVGVATAITGVGAGAGGTISAGGG